MSAPPTALNFFAQFPTFTPNPTATASSEFTRLAQHMNWSPKGKKYRTMRARCFSAEFSDLYSSGGQQTKLSGWQSLCREVGIVETLASITQCRQALSRVYVNIVDLVDCRRAGGAARRFGSLKALRNYSQSTGKIFPKVKAKQDGFLKALLRQVF